MEKLLKEGKIKKQTTDSTRVNSLLESAYKNFVCAAKILDEFEETSFKSAYEGLLQISKAILGINGYRTDDGEQHKTTFLVAGAILGDEFSDLILKIDKYRIRRNNSVYEPTFPITKSEAENILNTSKNYWKAVREYLEKKDPQLKLFALE